MTTPDCRSDIQSGHPDSPTNTVQGSAGGNFRVNAELCSGGRLVFIGHDLNPHNHHHAEYEYTITVAAQVSLPVDSWHGRRSRVRAGWLCCRRAGGSVDLSRNRHTAGPTVGGRIDARGLATRRFATAAQVRRRAAGLTSLVPAPVAQLVGNPARLVDRIGQYGRIGRVYLRLADLCDLGRLDPIAEQVLPQLPQKPRP